VMLVGWWWFNDGDRCRNRRRSLRGAPRSTPTPVCDATTPRDGWREGRVAGWLEAATTAEASLRSLADDCVDVHAVAYPAPTQRLKVGCRLCSVKRMTQ